MNTNTYQSEEARRRMQLILDLIDKHGTLQAHKLAGMLKWPPGTMAGYLKFMRGEKLIVPDDPKKTRYIFWSRPDEHGKPSVLPTKAELAPVPRNYKRAPAMSSGQPIVRRTNAADFKAQVPTDPMSQFLYGARKPA